MYGNSLDLIAHTAIAKKKNQIETRENSATWVIKYPEWGCNRNFVSLFTYVLADPEVLQLLSPVM